MNFLAWTAATGGLLLLMSLAAGWIHRGPVTSFGLFLIAGIPLLFGVRWLLAYRRRSKLGVAFVQGDIRRDWSAVLRFLPDIVLGLSLAFGIVALARPQRTDDRVVQ